MKLFTFTRNIKVKHKIFNVKKLKTNKKKLLKQKERVFFL